MHEVSTAWANASRETLLPEIMVELSYQVTDPGIVEAATVTGENANKYSKISTLLKDGVTTETKYGTLGWNTWGLGGDFEYYDPAYRSESFMGAYYSQYATPQWASGAEPKIILSFPELRKNTLPGIRIVWSNAYNEWASSFRVTAIRGESVVAEKTVVGNTDINSQVELPMTDYNRIEITILAWSVPYGMARCKSIYLGFSEQFLKEDLLGYTHSQSTDLLSAVLPKDTITFRMRNEESQWNPENTQGRGQYLSDQQEIRVRYGMNLPGGVEWIDGGVFWLSEWNIPSNGLEANFTARDLLTFMNETYSGAKTGTLYDIATAALNQTYLPKLSTGAPSYVLDPILKNYTTTFEGVYSISEVIQLVAHAGNCVIYSDRLGTLHVEPWTAKYSGVVIDQSISYTHPEYNISRPLKSVSVGYGADLKIELPGSNRGEVQTISNEMVKTQEDALRVGEKALEILQHRKVITGEFRADMRLDCLDTVIVTSKYASNIIALTDMEYSTSGGAFRGKYTGRVVSVKLETASYYVGDLYAGEV